MTTRDNLALCAMQVLLKEESKPHITMWQRIRRFFGLSHYTSLALDPERVALRSYAIADAMIDASEEQSND